MSRQYVERGLIMDEHDYLNDCSIKGMVWEDVAKRAAKIARMRGIMKAAKDAGCHGTYDNTRLRLKTYLKNINKRALQGKD